MKRKLSDEAKSLKNEIDREDRSWGVTANHSIFRASTTILTYINKKLYKYRVTQRSTAILNILIQHEGQIEQKHLAKSLDLTKQATASALRNLEKQHLITKETGSHDGRSNLIKITEDGLNLEATVLPMRKAFYELFIKAMSEEEALQLINILNRLSDRLTVDMKRKKTKSTQ